MPLTQQKHYTVGYHDNQHKHYEICEYAENSYQAIQNCKEDIPELGDHPSSIDYCVTEEVQKISDFLSSGILSPFSFSNFSAA